MQQFVFCDQRLWCRRSEGRLSWLADKHHLFSVIQNLEEKLKGQEKKGGVLKMGGDGGRGRQQRVTEGVNVIKEPYLHTWKCQWHPLFSTINRQLNKNKNKQQQQKIRSQSLHPYKTSHAIFRCSQFQMGDSYVNKLLPCMNRQYTEVYNTHSTNSKERAQWDSN